MSNRHNRIDLPELIRFLIVGLLNTVLDLVLLNIMTIVSGVKHGLGYSFQKACSAGVAIISSYLLNKYWSFKFDLSNNKYLEFSKFILISILSMVIHVTVATVMVSYVRPYFELYGPFIANAQLWVNIGGISGSIFSAITNYLGYKYIVFVRNTVAIQTSGRGA